MFKLFFDNTSINMKILYFVIFQLCIIISFKYRNFIIENYAKKYKFIKKLLIFIFTIILFIIIYNLMYFYSINLVLCIIINALIQCATWVLAISLFLS